MGSDIETQLRDVMREVLKEAVLLENLSKGKLKDIGFNSVTFIELIVLIEQKFDIEFEEEKLDFNSFETFESIVNYVKEQLEKR